MPEYRRHYIPGAMVFFTVITHEKRPLFTEPLARTCLRQAIEKIRKTRPFALDAIVLLPDHLHTLWTLPVSDGNFSVRWRRIKEEFTEQYLLAGGQESPRSASRQRRQERGIWQRRFWEHIIRDEVDFERHLDYIHYNPVKHGLVACPRDWPFSRSIAG
jgi:putative transposase